MDMQRRAATAYRTPALAAPGPRARMRAVLGVAFVVVVFALAASSVWTQRHQLRTSLATIGAWPLAASLLCAVLGVGLTYLQWHAVLSGLRARIPLPDGARIYFVSQLGKYLPGAVWPMVMQMEAGRRHHTSRAIMLTANVFTIAIGCTVGLLIACAVLPFSAPRAIERYWWSLLALPLLIVLMHPSVMLRVLNKALTAIGRAPVSDRLPLGSALRSAGWSAASFLLLGGHIAFLVAPLDGWEAAALPLSVGAISLAVCLGILAIPAPAGVGIRDTVMVLALSATLGVTPAIAVAVTSRVLLTLADVILATLALPGRRTRGPAQPRVRPQPTAGWPDRAKRAEPDRKLTQTMPASTLFVTRKFPPSTGGMETLSASIWRALQLSTTDVRKISHGGRNIHLIWWIPVTALRLTWLCLRGEVAYVLCGDAVMNAVCTPVLRVFGIQSSTMVMGLDVTFAPRVYRALAHPALRSARHVIAISAATAAAAHEVAGVDRERIQVLRPGVTKPDRPPLDRPAARAKLIAELGLPEDSVLLVTLGRLVHRKGVRWFSENVLPSLPDNVHLVVAGSGHEEPAIIDAAARAGVSQRLHLLGSVDDELREVLMTGGDLFVQPNIKVPGDMEGFGLVVVEAAFRGTPVVAARLEGLIDAVVSGVTGVLVEPEDRDAWIDALRALLSPSVDLSCLGERFRCAAEQTYSESAMGHALVSILSTSRKPREHRHS